MHRTFGEKACHPEHIRSAQCKLREGSGSTGAEILRFAQDDNQDTSPVRFREAFSPNICPRIRRIDITEIHAQPSTTATEKARMTIVVMTPTALDPTAIPVGSGFKVLYQDGSH